MIWEIKKILKTRGMIAVCLILVAVAGLYVYYLSKDKYVDYGMDDDIKELNRQYPDADELFLYLSEEYEYTEQQMAIGDYDDVYKKMNRLMPVYKLAKYTCVEFEKNREKTLRTAVYESLDVRGNNVTDEKKLTRSEMIQKYYGSVIKLEFANPGMSGFYGYFHVNVLDIVLLPIITLIAATAFTVDRTNNTDIILAGSSGNRRADALDRFAAATIIGIVIYGLVVIYEMIAARFIYNVRDFSLPIQQFEEYSMCPFFISIRQFFMLDFLCRVVMVIFIVATVDLICSFIRNGYMALFFGLITSMAPFLFYRNYMTKTAISGNVVTGDAEHKLFQFVRTVGPFGLMDIKRYLINLDIIYLDRWYLRVHLAIITSLIFSLVFLLIAVERSARSGK